MPSYGTVCVELFQGVVGLLENWYCRGTRTGTGTGKEASALMWSSRCWELKLEAGLGTGKW